MQYLLNLDQSIFYTLNSISGNNNISDAIFKVLAIWPVYLVCLGLLVGWFVTKKDQNKITALAATISGAVAWQVICRVIGEFIWFRPRPFLDMAGTKELFFHVPTYSFPSDHTAFLAAVAFYFTLAAYDKNRDSSTKFTLSEAERARNDPSTTPRAGNKSLKIISWILWIVVMVVGFSRVITGLHFPGDIIIGIVVGILTSLFFYEMRNFWYEKYFIRWLLLIAKKLKLA